MFRLGSSATRASSDVEIWITMKGLSDIRYLLWQRV
jgi:hypothetical protein